MRDMYDLRVKLCDELEQFSQKTEMGVGDLDIIHKLTDTIKNIDKIEKMDGGYSQSDGNWEARGSYDRGNSYKRHYVRGHYSRDEAKNRMLDRIEQMMSESDGRDRDILRRCMEQLER